MVENTVPSARLWIERSLVPKKIVVTASITCDRPKNRMIDSISGIDRTLQPRHQHPIEQHADQHENHERQRHREQGIDAGQRHDAERDERARASENRHAQD